MRSILICVFVLNTCDHCRADIRFSIGVQIFNFYNAARGYVPNTGSISSGYRV